MKIGLEGRLLKGRGLKAFCLFGVAGVNLNYLDSFESRSLSNFARPCWIHHRIVSSKSLLDLSSLYTSSPVYPITDPV